MNHYRTKYHCTECASPEQCVQDMSLNTLAANRLVLRHFLGSTLELGKGHSCGRSASAWQTSASFKERNQVLFA